MSSSTSKKKNSSVSVTFPDSDEIISYLKQQNVSLTAKQIRQLKDMKLSLKDLSIVNMNDEFKELCSDLKLSFGPKMKLKSAIIALKLSSTNNNEQKLDNDININDNIITDFYSTKQTITIVGCARVGKSSIKDVIMGGKFNENRFPTIKMPNDPEMYITQIKNRNRLNSNSLCTQSLPMSLEQNEAIDICYQIWDTPGQKVLEDNAKPYITGAMAVLVVYDLTDRVTFNRAKEWIKYIYDVAKGYDKVLLIGNKHDLNEKREITLEEANDFCMEYGYNFMETSAKTGKNINRLQKWMNSQTVHKVEKKLQEYKESNGPKNLDYNPESILLTVDSPAIENNEKKKYCC